MCFRPLLVKFLPGMFSGSHLSGSKQTHTPSWAHVVSSKVASKLRSGNLGVELHSMDGEGQTQDKSIRVQKTWTTETSMELQEQKSSA